jgi:tetratricopeptide (TPR) repeat protein
MRNPAVTGASNKLAKAQELAAAKGLRAAVPMYIDAANALAAEQRFDAAAGVLLDLLNLREKKRSLFGSKEVNPLGHERAFVAKQFAQATRTAAVNDTILELLATLAAEYPDEPQIRLANAEALYRAAYIADAIDEYRYCEQLQPQDGMLMARLGELYAMLSRNAEATDSLRRGLTRLQEQQKFDGFCGFCLKLIEVAPDSVNDVHVWLQGLGDDVLGAQRADATKLLDAVREFGSDDGRWADLENRLAALPEEVAAPEIPPAEELPQGSAWEDSSMYEPASEDEMRMLLGPTPAAEETQASGNNGIASETEESDYPVRPAQPQGFHINAGRAQATSAADDGEPQEREPSPRASARPSTPAPGSAISAAPAAPATAAALPPGLAAYTRRKGDGLLASGDYQAAAPCYERILKAGFEADVALPLLECYVKLARMDEATALGMQLADHQAAAGEIDKAVETLSKILEHTEDLQIEQRRSELLGAAQG